MAQILVIDDTPANVLLVKTVLVSRGFSVRSVATAAEMDEALETALPRLILLDIQLPDANGLEVLVRLKANERTALVPVIVLTADAMPNVEEQARRRGCDAFITKPFRLQQLVDQVTALLNSD